MNRESTSSKVIASMVLLYFVVRAIAEFFLISPGKPEAYRNDWGGPTYIGVIAVHCIPGIIAGYILWRLWFRRSE